MKEIFSGLALLYIVATALSIWSSLTSSTAQRRLLLTLAWIMTAIELMGVGMLFWVATDGASGRFARMVSFPVAITVLAPSLCSIFARKKPIQTSRDNARDVP